MLILGKKILSVRVCYIIHNIRPDVIVVVTDWALKAVYVCFYPKPVKQSEQNVSEKISIVKNDLSILNLTNKPTKHI